MVWLIKLAHMVDRRLFETKSVDYCEKRLGNSAATIAVCLSSMQSLVNWLLHMEVCTVAIKEVLKINEDNIGPVRSRDTSDEEDRPVVKQLQPWFVWTKAPPLIHKEGIYDTLRCSDIRNQHQIWFDRPEGQLVEPRKCQLKAHKGGPHNLTKTKIS